MKKCETTQEIRKKYDIEFFQPPPYSCSHQLRYSDTR